MCDYHCCVYSRAVDMKIAGIIKQIERSAFHKVRVCICVSSKH